MLSNDNIEEVLMMLAKAGLGPGYGAMLLLKKLWLPADDVKRLVYFSEAWAHMRKDIDRLHADAERAAAMEAAKSHSKK